TASSPLSLHDALPIFDDAGLTISALSCHGNPLDPDPATARGYDQVFHQTVRLAERLEVDVVVTFSGCPGDSDDAKHPNWVTNPRSEEHTSELQSRGHL